MHFLDKIKIDLANKINKTVGADKVVISDFVYPSDSKMGDLSLACFKNGITPGSIKPSDIIIAGIANAKWVGPYLNFYLDNNFLAKNLHNFNKEKNYFFNIFKKKKVIVEYATPNTHKAFHIGHLRNIITGEAITRILERNNYKVIRTNYQGDVGLHIAKCLWGINKLEDEYKKSFSLDIKERMKFIGKAYALGSKNYEEDEGVKKEIIILNKNIYSADNSIAEIYKETRRWSLDYFDLIYKRLGTGFDRLYFESEVFKNGKKIVLDGLKKNIFKKSDGAIIFEGEKRGLHDRVFINSEGNPTYEAKDMGLASLQLKEFSPAKIIHIVGPEQAEYFKVIFKAMEEVLPESRGREVHIPYGWVKLKDGKMSSRLGNVVLGEWLLDEVKNKIQEIINKGEMAGDGKLAEIIAQAAVKYSILKNGVKKDISFDIEDSINLSGDSGPYLQYSYARIKSILTKAGAFSKKIKNNYFGDEEHSLLVDLARYQETIKSAGENYDPSEIAKYLFNLSKNFNDYYHKAPILKAENKVRNARLILISAVADILKDGLYLLGIETPERM